MGESIWKKEISFKKKVKEEVEPAAGLVADATADEPAAAEQKVPWWKKEVSLGRKKAQPIVELAEPAAEAVAEAVAYAEPPAERQEPLDEVAERIAPYVAAAAEAAARAQAQAYAQAVEQTPSAVYEPTAQPEPEPEPEATVELPAVAQAAPAPEAVAPTVVPAAPDPVDTWTQQPEVPPAPEPVVVHPPVPAAELPPLPKEKPESKPFWKRELSLGRKKKEKNVPAAPEPEVERDAAAAPDEKPLPFWKREFSLGGTKKPKEKKKKKEKKGETAQPEEPKAEKTKGEKPRRQKKQKPLKERSKGPKTPKKLVGLKVGASQIAAARISNNGSAELVQAVREELDAGVVVGGELRDPEALAEALKEFFRRNKLPKRGVRLGIANNRIGVRTFEIGGIDDQKQLANAIRFRAQEALPIPIEEAVLDYQILGERTDEEGNTFRKILLVVAYRELVDRYLDACRRAGLQLVGIDLEAFALLRALAAPQEGAGGDAGAALVAVAIGHERSTFAVSDGRVCEFTRVLEWGGSTLNVAIARELNAAPSEVEDVKRQLSLVVENVPEGLTAEQATAARDAVRKQVQTFARELVSSLQFYQSQPGSLGIGEIVLTGGTAHLHGLEAELQRLIGVRVRVGDPLARVKVPKKFSEPEQAGSLAVAIGLGIED